MPTIDDPRVQPALDAMLRGDASLLAVILDRDPEVAGLRWGDNTLLEWTTQPPHGVAADVIELLIERSPSLDRALNLAGCWNLPGLCDRLIRSGADVAACADGGITPLESAAMHGSTAAADVLVVHGLHRHSLWLAAATGRIDLVSEWVSEEGALTRPPGDVRPDWTAVGRPTADEPEAGDGSLIDEAFVFAAMNARLETATLLLNRGADIDARPYASTTALHFAIQYRQVDSVRFPLARGAALDIPDSVYDSTAAGWAQACHDPDDAATAEIQQLIETAS